MQSLTRWIAAMLCLALLAPMLPAAEKVYREDGLIKARPTPVDEALRNTPWPAEMERGFWERANHAIEHKSQPVTANTQGENEKGTYPDLMFNYLAGHRQHALEQLQRPDIDARDHRGTLGIDWYWCFTIKGQIRKYFYFGDELDPAYRQRMYDAAKLWTAEDPRPSLELVLSLESPDPVARQYALELLRKMLVSREKLLAFAEQDAESPHAVQRLFAEHARALAEDWPTAEELGDDPEAWKEWWASIAAGDWQVFEEYERLANPRPHPVYGVGTGPVGGAWEPSVRGMWADARNTDNLRAMRETSVYLMAEETGNEKVRRLYKDKIRRFVVDLYRVGNGEWDSENYLAHTIIPYVNLYDFAQDPEVKRLAKAALDWLNMAGALKYYRGGVGGPTKRDYGGARRVFGSGLSHLMYLYFNDTPLADPNPHYDDVHAITSSYRPPLAVVGIARKDFAKPVEMWNAKPTYSLWLPGASERPEFFETMFFGDSYYLGTLTSEGAAGDVGAFKMMAYHPDRGADYVLANSGSKVNSKNAGDQIGQYRNLALWLRPADGKGFVFQIPGDAEVRKANGLWLIGLDRTFVAIRPIHLQADPDIRTNPDREFVEFGVKQTGEGEVAGFAMEIGEKPRYADLDAFARAVADKGSLAVTGRRARLTGTDGQTLEVQWNAGNNLPTVFRDGEEHLWADHFGLYGGADGGESPIVQPWNGDGTLTVTAGGWRFTQTVAEDGTVTWSEEKLD